MIGLVTDSNSQLPPDVAERYGVTVVPLTVTVDGVAYLEGEELGADEFYARFAATTPVVSTSQPSAGQFAQAYRTLAERGATEILSIHIGSSVSGTLNAARVAAEQSPVSVRLVDSSTASFGVAWCVWEAAEALHAGASCYEAALLAEKVGNSMGNVWVVGALDLARTGGRLAPSPAERGIPVLSMTDGVIHVIGRATDVDEAADAMAARVREGDTGPERPHGAGDTGPERPHGAGDTGPGARPLRVGLGFADSAAAPILEALARRLSEAPCVEEIVRYRIGPSVGAHTGPGTVGAMFYRRPASVAD